jgi:hypothetical protein
MTSRIKTRDPCITIFQFLVFITTNHQVASLKTLCKEHSWHLKIAAIILKVFFNLCNLRNLWFHFFWLRLAAMGSLWQKMHLQKTAP